MQTKLDIAKNWLPRYTGMPIDRFGDYVLLTNFSDYVGRFAERFGCEVYGEGRAMQALRGAENLPLEGMCDHHIVTDGNTEHPVFPVFY